MPGQRIREYGEPPMNGISSYPETGLKFSLRDLRSGAVIEFIFEDAVELLACLLDLL